MSSSENFERMAGVGSGPSRDDRWVPRGLLVLVLVAVVIRLYHITTPYVDSTAWRSLDYAAIARNYFERDFSFGNPRVDWAGPTGLVESELPLMPYLVALSYLLFGEQAWLGRLLTLIFSTFGFFYTFALVRKWAGAGAALASILVLALNPMHLYFSRTFQPDVPMLVAATAALYHLERFLEGRRMHGLFATLALALAGGLKLSALYVGIPMAVLVVMHRGWSGLLKRDMWLIAVLGLLPVAAWYWHARALYLTSGYTVGIFSGGHDKLQTLHFITMPYWWRVMLLERGLVWILTPAAIPLFCIGIYVLLRGRARTGESEDVGRKGDRGGRASDTLTGPGRAALLAWLLSGALFILVVAEGNIDMPHYQMVIVAPAAIVSGLGLYRVWSWGVARGWHWLAVSAFAILLLAGVGYALRDSYEVKRARDLELAEVIRGVKPVNGLLIYGGGYTEHKGGYDYEPMVFYYAHRHGWVMVPETSTPASIEEYQALGATVFACYRVDRVEAYPKLAAYLRSRHDVVEWNRERIVVRLVDAAEQP